MDISAGGTYQLSLLNGARTFMGTYDDGEASSRFTRRSEMSQSGLEFTSSMGRALLSSTRTSPVGSYRIVATR